MAQQRLPIHHLRPSRFQLWGLLLATTLLLAVALPAAGQVEPALIVTAIHPNAASPGQPMTISGQGFEGQAEEFYSWVDTSDSGFALNIDGVERSVLEGTVGDVAAPATGTVRVWRGYSHDLPDLTRLIQGRLLSLLETRLFVAQQRAHGPAFSAISSSQQTLGTEMLSGRLRIDLEPLVPINPNHPAPLVRVSAVIETGGSSGGGGTGNGGLLLSIRGRDDQPSGPDPDAAQTAAWAMEFSIRSDDSPMPADVLAAAVADLLSEQFGALDLQATSEGTELVLSHGLGIQAGFLTLSY